MEKGESQARRLAFNTAQRDATPSGENWTVWLNFTIIKKGL